MNSAQEIDWKVGYEFELLGPKDKTREDLADLFSEIFGGKTERYLVPQSELSAVPGRKSLENLTLGFRAKDRNNQTILSCVDDITIRAGLEKEAPSLPDWYRIVADDKRLLDLIQFYCDPNASQKDVLGPYADLFQTELFETAEGLVIAESYRGETLAIAATLPGERHRPCEVVTSPLVNSHFDAINLIFNVALEEGFGLAKEAATHIHFDASSLKDGKTLQRIILFFHHYRDQLRKYFKTNQHCTRLGDFSKEAIAFAKKDLSKKDWDSIKLEARESGFTKYCDVNVKNMLESFKDKDTIEIRFLPGSSDPLEVIEWTSLLERILKMLSSDKQLKFGSNFLEEI